MAAGDRVYDRDAGERGPLHEHAAELLQAASDLLDLWGQDDAPDPLAYEAACADAERALADAVAAAKGQNDEVQR